MVGCFLQVESMHGQGQPPSICPAATKAAIQHLSEVTAHCAVRRGRSTHTLAWEGANGHSDEA